MDAAQPQWQLLVQLAECRRVPACPPTPPHLKPTYVEHKRPHTHTGPRKVPQQAHGSHAASPSPLFLHTSKGRCATYVHLCALECASSPAQLPHVAEGSTRPTHAHATATEQHAGIANSCMQLHHNTQVARTRTAPARVPACAAGSAASRESTAQHSTAAKESTAQPPP